MVTFFIQLLCSCNQLEVSIFVREAGAKNLSFWQEKKRAFLYSSPLTSFPEEQTSSHSQKIPSGPHTSDPTASIYFPVTSLPQKCLERLRAKGMEKMDPETEIEFSATRSAKT